MPNCNDIITAVLVVLIIIVVVSVICGKRKGNEGFLSTTQRLTPNRIYNKNPIPNNILNSNSSIWSSPNMVNFRGAIDKIQYDEKRRPKYFPNEELFTASMTEGYRPGDWNVNGYTAMNMIHNIQRPPKTEGFSDTPTVNKFLGATRGLEDQPRQEPTRLADIPLEGFLPGLATDTKKDLNQIMGLEDQRYYIGEKFVPSYSNPYAPSYVRDEENYDVGVSLANKRNMEMKKRKVGRLKDAGEQFMPGFAASTDHAFNKLMNLEDQNYYLGEQWFPPAYYTNPHYMQDWINKFKPPAYKYSEGFIPGFATSTEQAFDTLMNQEDQDYYLGEQWFPPAYYTNPHYMQDWVDKFKPPRDIDNDSDLFKENSVTTPVRSTGVQIGKPAIEAPSSLTDDRNNIEVQDSKMY